MLQYSTTTGLSQRPDRFLFFTKPFHASDASRASEVVEECLGAIEVRAKQCQRRQEHQNLEASPDNLEGRIGLDVFGITVLFLESPIFGGVWVLHFFGWVGGYTVVHFDLGVCCEVEIIINAFQAVLCCEDFIVVVKVQPSVAWAVVADLLFCGLSMIHGSFPVDYIVLDSVAASCYHISR